MNIGEFLSKSSKEGLPLPAAYDAAQNKPSSTLLFMYLSNMLALASLVYLHVKAEPGTASAATCVYAVVQTVLYMFRRLQKAKFDLDDKAIELEGEDDKDS